MNNVQFQSIDILDISIKETYISLRLTEQIPNPPHLRYQQIALKKDFLKSVTQEITRILYLKGNDAIKMIKQLGYNFYQSMLDNSEDQMYQIINHLFQREAPLLVIKQWEESQPESYLFPIELAYNGTQFLSLFREVYQCVNHDLIMPRIPKEDTLVHEKKQTNKSMLIYVDPLENLPYAYQEGEQLYHFLNKNTLPIRFKSIDFISNPIKKLDWLEFYQEYDWIHFAGHGKIDDTHGPGICLNEYDLFTASDFPNKVKQSPEFIFFNTCFTGTVSPFYENCLIKEMGRLGLKNTLSSSSFIKDEEFFVTFVKPFYEAILNSNSIGESLKKAKIYNFNNYNMQWSYFHLHGMPYFKLS